MIRNIKTLLTSKKGTISKLVSSNNQFKQFSNTVKDNKHHKVPFMQGPEVIFRDVFKNKARMFGYFAVGAGVGTLIGLAFYEYQLLQKLNKNKKGRKSKTQKTEKFSAKDKLQKMFSLEKKQKESTESEEIVDTKVLHDLIFNKFCEIFQYFGVGIAFSYIGTLYTARYLNKTRSRILTLFLGSVGMAYSVFGCYGSNLEMVKEKGDHLHYLIYGVFWASFGFVNASIIRLLRLNAFSCTLASFAYTASLILMVNNLPNKDFILKFGVPVSMLGCFLTSFGLHILFRPKQSIRFTGLYLLSMAFLNLSAFYGSRRVLNTETSITDKKLSKFLTFARKKEDLAQKNERHILKQLNQIDPMMESIISIVRTPIEITIFLAVARILVMIFGNLV